MFNKVGYEYERALSCAYHKISKRGIYVNIDRLDALRCEVINEITNLLDTLSTNWSRPVYVGNIKSRLTISGTPININSSSGASSLLNNLKDMGYVVPKIRKKNAQTHEVNFEESANELALRQLFGDTGDVNIKHVLRIRELNKLLGTYINAWLFKQTYYCIYNVAGTVTGRRGSKKHIFGYGNNSQNFPKHSELGERFRKCLVARPGKILFSVDQMSAEDWPVSALAQNHNALRELSAKTWPENDRHTKLASFIFEVPIDSYTKNEWKGDNQEAAFKRYLAKKFRHANNYGMRGQRMSDTLAAEGFAFPKKACDQLLEKVDKYDPNIKLIFHTYVQQELSNSRTLRTPLGRERQFFGLRPNSPNYEILNEAYSYIPQSTVGDNTGFAVLYLDYDNNNEIIQEGHDSIVSEINDSIESLEKIFIAKEKAFDRELVFHNGIKIKIPIEAELGYDMGETIKLKEYTIDALRETYKKIKEKEIKEAPQSAEVEQLA